jgi:hypothetical protein
MQNIGYFTGLQLEETPFKLLGQYTALETTNWSSLPGRWSLGVSFSDIGKRTTGANCLSQSLGLGFASVSFAGVSDGGALIKTSLNKLAPEPNRRYLGVPLLFVASRGKQRGGKREST